MHRPVVARGGGLALALALGLLAAAPAALAHDERPARTDLVQAGPYALEIALYTDQPRTGQAFAVVVAPQGDPAPTTVRLVARPGLGTNATPSRSTLGPDPDAPDRFAGLAHLSVTGAWLLDVQADGPAGAGRATYAMTAAAPGAVPVWLGWLVGLSPLLGVVWLGWWQHRYLQRLEAAAAA